MRWLLIFSIIFSSALSLEAQQDSGSISETFVVKKIYLLGNTKTKDAIILRELTFKKGDTLNRNELEEIFKLNEKQLLNTNLFNEVDVASDFNNNVFVYVKEDWYLYPVPIVKIADRNFNQWWLSKDLNRLNYGLWTYWYNFTGNADKLTILLNNGYTKMIGLGYSIPFIDRKKHWGVAFESIYSSNREVWAYPENDKLKFFSDDNKMLIWRKGISAGVTYRKGHFDKHTLYSSFNNITVADTIISNEVNPNFLSQGKNSLNILDIGYTFIYDKRDIRGYPLKGYFLKTGLDYSFYNPGKSFQEQNFSISATTIFFTPLAKRIFFNSGITALTSELKSPPYIDFQALGYENQFVRGYEYYVIDGKDFAFFRSNLKYALIKDLKHEQEMLPSAFRTITLSCLAGFFFDAGYVNSPYVYANNTLPNSLLIGYGIGLDIVMYYDRVLRLELSRNGMGENGFYLSFYAPL